MVCVKICERRNKNHADNDMLNDICFILMLISWSLRGKDT